MKYVSLDIETTGLDPSRDQVLAIAMVAEDTAKPGVPLAQLETFNCLVRHPRYSGDAIALAMNAKILEKLGGDYETFEKDGTPWPIFASLEIAIDYACSWLRARVGWDGKPHSITFAGKNVGGFDLLFLPDIKRSVAHHRVIDPGSVFLDFAGEKVPSLIDLSKKLGVREPTHDALDDARAVIAVLRKLYAPRET